MLGTIRIYAGVADKNGWIFYHPNVHHYRIIQDEGDGLVQRVQSNSAKPLILIPPKNVRWDICNFAVLPCASSDVCCQPQERLSPHPPLTAT